MSTFKIFPLGYTLVIFIKVFHVAVVQNIFEMSSNSLLGFRPLFSGASVIPCVFLLRTDMIFETSKRALRIKFVNKNA